jgi:hypothetical protein
MLDTKSTTQAKSRKGSSFTTTLSSKLDESKDRVSRKRLYKK